MCGDRSDLSVNALTDLSLGVTNSSTIQHMYVPPAQEPSIQCSHLTSACQSAGVRYRNLSYNSFASIPSDVFKLSQLDQLCVLTWRACAF